MKFFPVCSQKVSSSDKNIVEKSVSLVAKQGAGDTFILKS